MKIGSDKWIDLIRNGASKLGVTVDVGQAGLFARHGQWLMEWNRRINLTAITDPKQVAVKHFIDAIAPIDYIPETGQLLDIGTGGGFPGIPIKVMRPELSVTLIDSVRKKINFVKHVIRQLSLSDIQARHTRAEAICKSKADAGKYDVVVCRALADLDRAVTFAGPFLKSNGKIVLYQGPNQNADAVSTSPDKYSMDGVTYHRSAMTYELPIFGDDRMVTILEIEK